MPLIFKWKELFLNSILFTSRRTSRNDNIKDLCPFLADLVPRGLIRRPILQMEFVCNKESKHTQTKKAQICMYQQRFIEESFKITKNAKAVGGSFFSNTPLIW